VTVFLQIGGLVVSRLCS